MQNVLTLISFVRIAPKNGEVSGTSGQAKRLEGIEMELEHPNYDGSIQYRTHVQGIGWQGWVFDGQMSGTSGQAKRLEGIELRLADPMFSGSIQYRTHVQSYGWQGWVQDGAMSGTSGQSKRLEAIQIRLTGEMASRYDVWYRVHAQTFGWMGWTSNGVSAGTEGYSKRLEAIEIVLTAKGASAPGSTANAFRKFDAYTYISGKYQNWSVGLPGYWKDKVDVYREEVYRGRPGEYYYVMPKGYPFTYSNYGYINKFLIRIYAGPIDGYMNMDPRVSTTTLKSGQTVKVYHTDGHDPNLTTLYVGARGSGKTTLLNLMAEEAASCGWVPAQVSAIPGMLEDVLVSARRSM